MVVGGVEGKSFYKIFFVSPQYEQKGGENMSNEWKKVCKVCNKDFDPENPSAHDKCLQYSNIIRNVKT